MAFDATPVTVDNGENTDYTAAVRTTDRGKIVGCQVDIGDGATTSPVTPANPMPVYVSSAPSGAPLTEGGIISEGQLTSAAIEADAGAGLDLVVYVATPILSVMFFNRLTSEVEISLDGGFNWVTLLPLASPSIDFGSVGRALTANIQVRKKGATSVVGTDLMAWGKV